MPQTIAPQKFFIVMAALALASVVIGFSPTFFLRNAFDAADLSPRVHVHAVLFTLWPVLLLTQALLIRRKMYRLHRTVGIAAAVLVIAVVISGFIVVFGKPRPTIEARAFIFTPLLALILFPLFVGFALKFRDDPATHKRLMLLATILLMNAGVRRTLHLFDIDYMVQTTTYALFLVPLLVHDLRHLGRLHRATAWGAAVLLLRHPLHELVAYTDQWQHLAARLTAP